MSVTSLLFHPPSHATPLSKPLKRTRSTIHSSSTSSSYSSSPSLQASSSPSYLSSSPFASTACTSRDENDDDPLYSAVPSAQRRHPRLSYPPYPYHLPSSTSSFTSTSASSPSSSSTSSPFLSTASTPSISPLSPSLPLHPAFLLSRRSSSPSSTSSAAPPHPPLSPSLKRLCIDDPDEEDDDGPRRRRRLDAEQSLLVSFSSFSLSPSPPAPSPAAPPAVAHQAAVCRVFVRGKRTASDGLPFTPPPRPHHPLPPAASVSVSVSPAPGAGPLSSSLPSSSTFSLSQLLTSSSSSSSSSSSPMHSPSSSSALPSALPTPSSASLTGHRPRLMSPQERAALFPSRSVSSSPLPPPALAAASARRVSTGKRHGLDSPSSASSYRSHPSDGGQGGGRGSKRVKEERRRDRRCSFAYTDDSGHLLPNVDDDAHGLGEPSPTSSSQLKLLMMGSTSSSSLSSLDSPSYASSYPSAAAPLNSPVSGGQQRRFCHIEQGDLLGTAAAAASVARRGQGVSLYGTQDEGELVDAVEKCRLEEHKQAPPSSVEEQNRPDPFNPFHVDDDETEELPRLLPAAPRLATRSTSLRVTVVPSSSSLLPVASDDEDEEVVSEGGVGVVQLSPLLSRAVSASSSSGECFSEFIRTGSFSQAVRSARQQRSIGWSRTSSISNSPFPVTPEPILSPLSSSLVAPPGSPVPSASMSTLSSFPLPSAVCHPQPPLSPFALLPSSSPSFARSLSMGVRGAEVGRRGGLGWADKSRASVAGSGRRRLGEGEGQGEDVLVVPFLKELSLPPRVGTVGVGEVGEVGSGMLARFRASRAGRMEVQTSGDS